jgi:hypothetical protein
MAVAIRKVLLGYNIDVSGVSQCTAMSYVRKRPNLRGGTQALVEERRRNRLSKLSLEVFLLEVDGKRLPRGGNSRLA